MLDRAPAISRRDLLVIAGVWLVAAMLMVWGALPNLAERTFPDPDDAMRLMQVRDWLAGQSWFDVTQYRLNPPAGGPMHWSRLVDMPIAAVISMSRPFVGQYNAETAALIAVPLLTLGITMLLVHRIASKLVDPVAALLAVIGTPMTLGAMKQMRIMRIDHHGWQIVMALVATLGVLDERRRRGGIIAGIAMAVWLNISIEGLPFAAALGAWFALEWLRDAAATERLKSYLGSLAAGSLLLFAGTHLPAVWLTFPHDAVNPSHLAAFVVAWACCQAVVWPTVGELWKRVALLGAAGFVTIGITFGIDPNFLQPPFASLDPLVRSVWYTAVDEGLPVWQLSPTTAAEALAQPLVGLAGALLALNTLPPAERRVWAGYAWVLVSGTAASLFVVREATTTSVLCMPATAYLCAYVLTRARRLSVMPVRSIATAAALCVMAPAYAVPAVIMPENVRLTRAMQASDACVTRSQLDYLNHLPPTDIAAPMDITPAILAITPHRAIASGYHRNVKGIHDEILLFVSPPAQARNIIENRHIAYIVFCPHTPETLWWTAHGPTGLAAMLNRGQAPGWLERVPIAGMHPLQVWRVRRGA